MMLDGSGSGGAWGTNVTYSWALTTPTTGVTVTFDNDSIAKPTVTIPQVTAGTDLVFTLTVTGRGGSDGGGISTSHRHRQGDGEHHRARRPDQPLGNGQREHPDQPLVERPGQYRRLRHHRLQDRGLAQWHLELDRPRRQHRQHHHHLRPHRAGRRHHAPLPRLGHQRQRHRHSPPASPSATTGTATSTSPGRPRNLDAAASGGAVTLSWQAPANSGGSAIVRYEVRHAEGTSVPANTAWQSAGLNLSHAISGLTNGQVYTFQVRAVNSSTPSTGPPAEVQATPMLAVGPPRVSIGPWLLIVAEDVGDAVLTVSLDRPAASALSVAWETQDHTAESPDDFTASEGPVTFRAGETRKTISVPIVDDAVREDPVHDVHEIFFVYLSPGPGYTMAQTPTADSSVALVEIVDNDGVGSMDTTDDALALVDDLTPEVAAAVLLGEQTLGEAQLDALDRLGNGNGRYDLGDLLSWIARCRRGEARCGSSSTDSGPAAAALLGGAAAGKSHYAQASGAARFRAPGARIDRRHSPSGAKGRTGPRHPARGHDLVVHRGFGGTGPLRAGSGLPDGRVERAGNESRCRRSAGVRGSHNRRRAGSRSRVVRIQRARTAPDRRGGRPPPRSPRAVPRAGPQPVRAVQRPRPRGYGRGLRAQGRRGVPGRHHAALTTPAKMGPPTCAARFECVGGPKPTAARARAGVARVLAFMAECDGDPGRRPRPAAAQAGPQAFIKREENNGAQRLGSPSPWSRPSTSCMPIPRDTILIT